MTQADRVSLESFYRRSVVILMVLAVIAAMKAAAPILTPIGVAAFLVAIAWPIKSWLNKRLPNSLSYIGSFIALTGVLVAAMGVLYTSTIEIMETAPKYRPEIREIWKDAKSELAVNGVDTTQKIELKGQFQG